MTSFKTRSGGSASNAVPFVPPAGLPQVFRFPRLERVSKAGATVQRRPRWHGTTLEDLTPEQRASIGSTVLKGGVRVAWFAQMSDTVEKYCRFRFESDRRTGPSVIK